MRKINFEEDSFILKIMFFIGLFILIISIVRLVLVQEFTFVINISIGIGILLILLYIYKIYEPSIGIPYFLAGLFAIIGIGPILSAGGYIELTRVAIESEETPLRLLPIIPIYIALLFYRIIAWYHKSSMQDCEYNKKQLKSRENVNKEKLDYTLKELDNLCKHYSKGYVIALDALIFIASFLILYITSAQVFSLEPLSITKIWYEGFYTSIIFLLTVLNQRDMHYYKSLGNKFNYYILLFCGAFLIIFSVTKFLIQNNIGDIFLLFGTLVNSLIGVVLIYLTRRLYFREEE